MAGGKRINTTWIHVFKEFVLSGVITEVGPTAFTIWMVLRASTDVETGIAHVRLQDIADLLGISTRQVLREVRVLEDLGYLQRRRTGRETQYTILDNLNITKNGKPVEKVTFPYVPMKVKEICNQLRYYVKSENYNITIGSVSSEEECDFDEVEKIDVPQRVKTLIHEN